MLVYGSDIERKDIKPNKQDVQIQMNKTIKNTLMATTAAAALLTVGASTQANADDINDNDNNVYTVKAGDTLSEIAQAHNTNAVLLAKNSGIKNIDLIFIGEKIKFSFDNQRVEAVTTPTGEVQTASQPVASAPVQTATPAVQSQPVIYQPVATAQASTTPAATQTVSYTGQSSAAKDYIASVESGGSYDARNGNYIGKYQLSSSYLNGDYSAENQERVADQYVQSRYGSWENAASHSQQYGWY
ncbi:hypothetical protein R078138_00319 [Convivina praedatoris]|uniref:LysM domain-containing protein n=3 Tax=Convivina praedatoris TaxID=2880963 RepID=A0ABM9CZM3_9LACO|nr:hypothetical protein R077815_00011 [Convivina sp. LMG 32447]CAH1849911.1 hypothetical protein LMG032447_00013 [Convivina sp. LMG 32447]CAH1851338.1 hypothetical protein R078138_00319 [Convivina sp. LMG 32447]